MTLRKVPQCVRNPISPIDGIGASPLFGTASAGLEPEVDTTEIDAYAPPLELADHDEAILADVIGGVGEEETRKPKVGRRRVLPTKAEVEEHFPLHFHYRSWCRHSAERARVALRRTWSSLPTGRSSVLHSAPIMHS